MNAPVRHSRRRPDPLAVVALGSNLGDSTAIVRAAMEALAGLAAGPLIRSSLWRSQPVDCPPDAPQFINAVVAFKPVANETPEALLAALQELEAQLGRRRTGTKNEARTLDLDLIAFGPERRSSASLTLPHPRAHQRGFVLAPLAEILPAFQAPGWPHTAAELLRQLPDPGAIRSGA